jgi:copper chaperone CopZ
MTVAKLKIGGMSCEHCVRAVREALESAPGVARARVDLKEASAVVDFDESKTSTRELAGRVAVEGYTAEPEG